MPRLPSYRGLTRAPDLGPKANAGLWHGRFFDRYAAPGDASLTPQQIKCWHVDGQAAGKWLKELNGPCGDAGQLARAATRQQAFAGGLRAARTRCLRRRNLTADSD